MVETASSVYAVVASWLTPSCLFIFINLVIGTIAVTSRFATQKKRQQQQQERDSPGQLVRSTSLLDRVMSFNLGYYKYQPQTLPESEFSSDPVQENRDSPQLARAPSMLDRVKSFNLGLYKTEEKQEDPCPNPDDPTRQELTRAPSLLERFKSMKFYRWESIEKEKEEPGTGPKPIPEPVPEFTENGLGRGNLVEGRVIRNSRKWEGEELLEEEVDKKADDFINRFKQQLRLQRLDSILRYRDMLKGN